MMKNLPICVLLLMAVCANAQPQLVSTFTFSGPKDGGAIHRMNLPGTSPGVIHTFDNYTPHYPTGGVVYGNANWLYGFLQYNGTNRDGALYKIRDDGSLFTKIYDASSPFYLSSIPYYHTDGIIYFSTGSEVKKYDPVTNLITDIGLHNFGASRTMTIDADGWMYFVGGSQNPVIFRTKTDNSAAQDLVTLTGATHGWNGIAGLTEVGDSIFGVMQNGGANDEGTIYSIKKDGTGLAVHHHFTIATGRYPESKLVYFDGKLYGTTSQGGDFTNGVLYTINPDGTGYQVLHHFTLSGPANVRGNIAISSNGRIFGTYGQFSQNGGQWRAWKVDTSGGNFEDFMNIDQRESGHGNQDILLADDETIILTTSEMGRHDGGALNLFDTSGTGSSLYHFGLSPNGFRPNPLIKSTNGNIYGTTTIGGAAGNGTIYTMNADGTGYQKLHEFTDAEGYEPSGKLLEASDGKLYGTTRWGGPVNGGLLFRMDKTGANFQVLYSFPLITLDDPYSPLGGLVEDNAGFLYGTSFYSNGGSGSVFRVSKTGSGFTVLKTFNADIRTPWDGLKLDNGWLYGTCSSGGAGGNGGVYRIQTNGTGYQVLHDFIGTTLGAVPFATPSIFSNGKLYGSTNQGGLSGEGTLWSMDLNGANFTSLKSFTGATDGSYPVGSLIQGTNGLIYGINGSGGPAFGGTVYSTNLDGSNFTVVNSYDYQTVGQQINGLLDLNGNFVLPVELIAFNAEKKTSGVLLSWKTAQEQNSDRFEIERSATGNNFTSIGTVRSAGNTTSITTYSFTDPNPINGINYYRLKQVDMDEKFTHSKTIPVDCSTISSVVISPNPVTDKLQLRLPLNSHFTSLRILDVTGKPVFQKAILSSSSQQFDISHLAKGWYVLQLLGDKEERQVFVKQ